MFSSSSSSSSSSVCCFRESAVKSARELRRRAEKEEEDESEDAFARALREALVFFGDGDDDGGRWARTAEREKYRTQNRTESDEDRE